MYERTSTPGIEGFPYEEAGIKYFITLNLLDEQPLLTDMEEVPELIQETIEDRCENFGYLPIAAVVMPDHVHFLLENQAGDHELSRVIRGIKSKTTHLMWEYGFDGQIWQEKYFERYLRTKEEYEAKRKYIRDNPANEGLVNDTSEQWRWTKFWV